MDDYHELIGFLIFLFGIGLFFYFGIKVLCSDSFLGNNKHRKILKDIREEVARFDKVCQDPTKSIDFRAGYAISSMNMISRIIEDN